MGSKYSWHFEQRVGGGLQVYHIAALKLNKMDAVGIMESMERSVELIACALGVKRITVPKRNVGAYAQVQDDVILQQIEALLALDMRVYDFAKDLFQQRLRALHFMHEHYRYC